MVSKYEKIARKELREKGWLVDWKLRPTRPISTYSVDYFNAFDILAYKKGKPLKFVSIKGHAGVPKAHRNLIKSFKFLNGVQTEIWTYKKRPPNSKRIMVRKEVIYPHRDIGAFLD